MDVNVFRNLSSEDDKERADTETMIMELFENPDFIVFLCEALKENTRSDSVLLNGLAISLLLMIRRTTANNVYDDTGMEYIKQSLTELLFEVPKDCQRHILECIKVLLNSVTSGNWDACVSECMEILAANDDFEAVVTSISFMRHWIDLRINCTKETKDEVLEFSEEFIPLLFNSLTTAVSVLEEEHNDAVVEFMCNCACVFQKLAIGDNVFTCTNFVDVLRIIPTTLLITVQSNVVSQCKMDIVENCLRSLIQNFGGEVAPKLVEFRDYFVSEFAEFLVECCFNGIEHVSDPVGINAILMLLLLLIDKGLVCDNIFIPELLENIILPAALLNDDDLESFEELPEHFIAFCLVTESEPKPDVPRKTIARIVKKMPEDYAMEAMDMLVNVPPTAEEFEAQIFVMSMILMHHKDIDRGPVFEMATEALSSDPPPFLAATLLSLLEHSNTEHEECSSLACDYLINYPSVVVKCVAADLFSESFDEMCMELSHPVDVLIQAIFSLADEIQETSIARMLEILVKTSPLEYQHIASDLILHIMELWKTTVCEGSDDARAMLCSVTEIIKSLPEETIMELVDPVVEYCINGLEIDVSESQKQLCDILSVICEKIEPDLAFFSLIRILGEFIMSDFNDMFITDVAPIIEILITKDNFLEAEGSVEAVMEICDLGLDKWGENCNQSEWTSCLFKIMICLIEKDLPEEILGDILSRALAIVDGEFCKELTIWAIGAVATAVRISHCAVLDQLTETTIDTWCSLSRRINKFDSLAKMSSIALLMMAIATENVDLLVVHAEGIIEFLDPEEEEDFGETGRQDPFGINQIDFKAAIRELIEDKMDFIEQLPVELCPDYMRCLMDHSEEEEIE